MSLLALARSTDANKAVFCLSSLARESADADFEEVLSEVFQGLRSVRPAYIAENRAALEAALRDVVATMGASPYVGTIARQDKLTVENIALVLAPVRAGGLQTESAVLCDIARFPRLDDDTIVWLAGHAASEAGIQPELIRPLLNRYGQDEASEAALRDAAVAFLADTRATALLRTLLHDTSGAHVPGVLLLLGLSGDAQQIPVLGPFLEDFGAWERISMAVLTPQRVRAVLERTQQSDLARQVGRSAGANSDEARANALASDPDFHRSVARFISGASLLSVASSLADAKVAAALKGFVSDVDAPLRQAAARALALFKHHDAVPFLRRGLVDRDKRVREVCQAALEEQLGKDRYDELLQEMHEESRSLRERLGGLGEWARSALTEIEGGLSSAAAALYAGSAAVATKTRDMLGWSRSEKP